MWLAMHSRAANSTAARVGAQVLSLISGMRMVQPPISWPISISKHCPAIAGSTRCERGPRWARAERRRVLWRVGIFRFLGAEFGRARNYPAAVRRPNPGARRTTGYAPRHGRGGVGGTCRCSGCHRGSGSTDRVRDRRTGLGRAGGPLVSNRGFSLIAPQVGSRGGEPPCRRGHGPVRGGGRLRECGGTPSGGHLAVIGRYTRTERRRSSRSGGAGTRG